MSENTISLRRKITSAGELQSVVRTMKTLAASNIGQYEKSVAALSDYYNTVERGLSICLKQSIPSPLLEERSSQSSREDIGIVVFGSDQGLVGQFNDIIADYTISTLGTLPGKPQVWAVGERVYTRLNDAGISVKKLFAVPKSIKSVTPLIGQILIEYESLLRNDKINALHLFYNRPTSGASYVSVSQRLLPLDENWRRTLTDLPWPRGSLPEVIGNSEITLRALIREYLFVSIFRACTESLASENSSRLTAMQRAEKNIDELLEAFNSAFHRVRQSGIDEELFDVISGFEALNNHKKR